MPNPQKMQKQGSNRRRGEEHHFAVLTDAQVERIRQMHEGGGWSYGALAEKFDVAKSTVFDICTHRRRRGA